MNQKEAVFEVIKKLKKADVEAEKPVQLTKQEKQVVHQELFEGFRKGKIQYNGEKPSDDKLLMYISGLVSNWLRKDTRLNGGTRYQPRRPGSRTGTAPPVTVQTAGEVNPAELDSVLRLAGGAAPGAEVRVFVIRPAPQQPQRNDGDGEQQDSTAHQQ